MICFKCGTNNEDTSQFCIKCGEKLVADMMDTPIGAINEQAAPYQQRNANVPQTNVLAIISLVVSLLSLSMGGLTSIVAVICGHIARKQIRENPAMYTGNGMALSGLIIGYLGIAVILAIILFYVLVFGAVILAEM